MKYKTIVADPPWDYPDPFGGYNAAGKGRMVRRKLPYESMTVEQIAALPITELADPAGANVFMWTTNRHLPSAFEVFSAWTARYRLAATASPPSSASTTALRAARTSASGRAAMSGGTTRGRCGGTSTAPTAGTICRHWRGAHEALEHNRMEDLMVAKYRKKPVTIEAALIADLIYAAGNDWDALPEWVKEGYDAGNVLFLNDSIEVKTLEGTHTGQAADMLIRGVQGELYPCKPDIFQQTYDPA